MRPNRTSASAAALKSTAPAASDGRPAFDASDGRPAFDTSDGRPVLDASDGRLLTVRPSLAFVISRTAPGMPCRRSCSVSSSRAARTNLRPGQGWP